MDLAPICSHTEKGPSKCPQGVVIQTHIMDCSCNSSSSRDLLRCMLQSLTMWRFWWYWYCFFLPLRQTVLLLLGCPSLYESFAACCRLIELINVYIFSCWMLGTQTSQSVHCKRSQAPSFLKTMALFVNKIVSFQHTTSFWSFPPRGGKLPKEVRRVAIACQWKRVCVRTVVVVAC